MAEKHPGCGQGDPARDAGAAGGDEHPRASPVGSGRTDRQTLFHLLVLGVSPGCAKAAGDSPASWEPLLGVPSDSCDSCGWQKKRSERKRNGKESVAIFNHK